MEIVFYFGMIILTAIFIFLGIIWSVVGIRSELRKQKYYDLLIRDSLKEDNCPTCMQPSEARFDDEEGGGE